MKFGHRTCLLLAPVLLIVAMSASSASAQSLYTATQLESLSVWAGGTGTFVNLPVNTTGTAIPVVVTTNSSNTLFNGGKNLGISVGVNLRIWQFHGFLPSIEIRGTYPVASGNVAGEENGLGGIKIEHYLGRRYHLYGDFFYGRSSIKYQAGGYLSPNGLYLYQRTYSNVLAPGGGVDIDLTHHFAAKLDAQVWHQTVPVTTSGKLNSLAVTVGAIYRFDFNTRPKVPRSKPASAPPQPSNPAANSPTPPTGTATPSSIPQ